MPQYTPPLRDMQFVLHELLNVVDEFKMIPAHAEVDADTINAVLEEGGKFAAEVIAPINLSGDSEGCQLDRDSHEVTPPKGFKEAYAKYVEGGWPALSRNRLWRKNVAGSPPRSVQIRRASSPGTRSVRVMVGIVRAMPSTSAKKSSTGSRHPPFTQSPLPATGRRSGRGTCRSGWSRCRRRRRRSACPP